MSKIDVDFLKVRPTSPWMRWVLFAIAAAFALDMGIAYFGMRGSVAENEQRLSEIHRSTATAAKAGIPTRAPSPEEIRVAADTLHKLAMPWHTLFRALESTANDKVSLLAIEPEPKAGTVLISGEATTYHAALDYVALLGSAAALERPHLVRHERRPDDARDAVAFTVMASWGKTK
ncbi:MAG: PilN domain-containing protein [Betaproteobacteria bacterium]